VGYHADEEAQTEANVRTERNEKGWKEREREREESRNYT
jgi:hypothetical protein